MNSLHDVNLIDFESYQLKLNELMHLPLFGKLIRLESGDEYIFGKIISETKNTFLVLIDDDSKYLKRVIKFRKQAVLIDGFELPASIFFGTLKDRLLRSYSVHR